MKAARVGLMLSALSSCNGLTGIYDLSPGEGLGGSGDDAVASGGRPRAAGGSVASGGRKSASGGSVESSGGERSSGGAREGSGGAQEGSGGTREGAGGAREGGGGSGGEGAPESTGGVSGAGGSAPSGGAAPTGGDQSAGGQGTGGLGVGGLDGPGSVGGSGGQTGGQLPLLDDFSTPLDTVRWKELFDFEAKAGLLECRECTRALLWDQTYSMPLGASVRLMSFGSTAEETNLVLLASSPECDLIEVVYIAAYGYLAIASCQIGGWQTHTGKGLFLGAETVLGGRVRRGAEPGSVVVEALVNGTVELTATFPFVNASGSIGVNGLCAAPDCAGPVRFDEFRGGELAE